MSILKSQGKPFHFKKSSSNKIWSHVKAEANILLDVQGLSLKFENRLLFEPLSFSVQPGEFVAIVGRSGSGKTSLLRSIAGKTPSEQGLIENFSQDTLCYGTIYQDLELAEGATTINNALSGCLGRYSTWQTLFGFPGHEKEKAYELLDRLGLTGQINQWTSTLSRGERQRLAIVRTLLADPCILLADEPVASLDSEWAFQVLELLQEFAKSGEKCVICSLHDANQVERFADQIIRIQPPESLPDQTKS
jgi:phosphonate transport system ATP-binding protein